MHRSCFQHSKSNSPENKRHIGFSEEEGARGVYFLLTIKERWMHLKLHKISSKFSHQIGIQEKASHWVMKNARLYCYFFPFYRNCGIRACFTIISYLCSSTWDTVRRKYFLYLPISLVFYYIFDLGEPRSTNYLEFYNSSSCCW